MAHRHRFTGKDHPAFMLPEPLVLRCTVRAPSRCDFPAAVLDEGSPPRKTGVANLSRPRPGPERRRLSLEAAIGMRCAGCQGGGGKMPPGTGPARPPTKQAGHRK